MSVEAFTLKDSKGRVFTASKRTGNMRGPDNKTVESSTTYQLIDGRALNYDSASDTFEIAETGERLVRMLPIGRP